jgi:hypothetical protein
MKLNRGCELDARQRQDIHTAMLLAPRVVIVNSATTWMGHNLIRAVGFEGEPSKAMTLHVSVFSRMRRESGTINCWALTAE